MFWLSQVNRKKLNVRKNRRCNQIWTIQRHWQHWSHKRYDENNPETLATLVTQEIWRKQSRDTGNIGHTRDMTKTLVTQEIWRKQTTNNNKQNTTRLRKIMNMVGITMVHHRPILFTWDCIKFSSSGESFFFFLFYIII